MVPISEPEYSSSSTEVALAEPAPLDPAGYIAPPLTERGPAIEVRKLTKRYGRVTAINGVTFRVERGEIVGFLGPNGAGKSTTMRVLTGLLAADSGEAYVAGIPVATRPLEVQRHIGFMSEHNPLPEDMRVCEYLRLRAKLKGLRGRRLRQREDEVKRLVELDPRTCRKLIAGLSKGFRQRVGIADALLNEPEIVIMDEPTIGLDPHQIRAMRGLIRSLRDRMTVILSSHILSEIEACCDRVIIINHGRIVAQGSPAELRREFLPQRRYRVCSNLPPRKMAEYCKRCDSPLTVVDETRPDETGFRIYWLDAAGEGSSLEPLVYLASEAGGRVREAALVDPKLEDVFIAATRKSWNEGDERTGLSQD